jgi:hypothetical protein
MPSAPAEHTFSYVDVDVPPGMTLSAWRAEKVRESRGRCSGRLLLRRRGR